MALVFANNSSLANITALPSGISGGALNLISTQTASASATIDFTSGIDDTYDSYVFKFINIHPATDQVGFQFNMSTDGGSNYNVTKTTTFFISYHNEADTASALVYNTANDLAQSTSFQTLIFPTLSNDNDSNTSGILTLYNPSSTTFVKHFISRLNCTVEETGGTDPYSEDIYVAGYGNTTSAVNAVRFQMSSGNIDDGIIKMYGVK
jgi:hypothetical protein